MTAVAFERALGSHWIVSIILAAALLSLFKVFNGNFVAASRLLFALGRRGLVTGSIAYVHPRNQTPSRAILWMGAATAACMFLGDALLIPITEVGGLASATGWLAACAVYYRLADHAREKSIAGVGVAVSLAMILMKVLPGIPGHFSGYEWVALAAWIAAGILLSRTGERTRRIAVANK